MELWTLRDLLKKRQEGKKIKSPTNEAYKKLWEKKGKKENEEMLKNRFETFKEVHNRYLFKEVK